MKHRFVLLLWAAPLAAQAPDPVRNPRTTPADIAAGAQTFRSHCSPCHGMNGTGGRGPNLTTGQFFHGSSDAELLNTIAEGVPGTDMPGMFYSDDRIWQIVAYIRSLNAGAAGSQAGDPGRGAAVFRSNGCFQCHRINGEGGRLGPDLSTIGQARAPDFLRQSIVDPGAVVPMRYWVVTFRDASGRKYQGFLMNEDTYTVQFIDMQEQLHSFAKSGLQDYKVEKTSRMPSFKDSLPEPQLQDLVAYLSSLRSKGVSQ